MTQQAKPLNDTAPARRMRSRLVSKCWNCGGAILEGDCIFYAASMKRATHVRCGRPVR